jgi:hypothetical protein
VVVKGLLLGVVWFAASGSLSCIEMNKNLGIGVQVYKFRMGLPYEVTGSTGAAIGCSRDLKV